MRIVRVSLLLLRWLERCIDQSNLRVIYAGFAFVFVLLDPLLSCHCEDGTLTETFSDEKGKAPKAQGN